MSTLSYNPDAVWISHSALDEFYRCPKSYYYRYLYTNSSGNRVTLAEPNLTLGVIVDDVVKYFFKKPNLSLSELLWYLDFQWKLKSGKSGGFKTASEEAGFRDAAVKMITNFYNHFPETGIKAEVPEFLQMTLMETGDTRLCGTPDLIEYLPDGTIHIIDLKTSEKEKTEADLQLPIYTLLIENETGKKVSKASYWYLRLHDKPQEVVLDKNNLDRYLEDIKFKTQALLNARASKDFKCLRGEGGCFKCANFEFIKNGTAQIVGRDKKRVVYFVDPTKIAENNYSDDLPF